MKQPGKLKPPKRMPKKSKISNWNNKINELESNYNFGQHHHHEKHFFSGSNVTEPNDDLIQMQQTIHQQNECTNQCSCCATINSLKHNFALINHQQHFDDIDFGQTMSSSQCCHSNGFNDYPSINCSHLANCCKQLAPIIRELKFITNRMRREDEITEKIDEWKFAAMVIDRVCFILFTSFAVLSTAICLFSAPHIIV